METSELHSGWTVTATGGDPPDRIRAAGPIAAQVPGCIHTDLLAAGLIPDPYRDANELALRGLFGVDWRWTRELDLAAPADDERIDLVFAGIDTVATVAYAGVELGRTENMHRSYRFDVRALADGRAHPLVVDIFSATTRAEQLRAELGPRPSAYPDAPFNTIRKMACSFGWDWGPDLRTAGIWKPVRVQRWRVARLAEVRPTVTVGPDGTGRVVVDVVVERSGRQPAADLALVVSLDDHRAAVTVPAAEDRVRAEVEVPDVALWWPVGYGEQPLFDLVVELGGEDRLDRWSRRVGFRTVEWDRSADEHGHAFLLRVNGRDIAVKGANWIPDDHVVTRITPGRLAARLDQAVGAHLNLLRVWGGGLYESDDFYAAADARGLLVWQDFPLACAAYPEEEPLRSEFAAEARENVVRLLPHPSLVLFNGGNENLWGHRDWGWPEQLHGRTWGEWYATTLFHDVVAELDPTRAYADNSPYGPDGTHPNDPDHFTHHQWEVWNRLDYTAYRSEIPRFCSEFGFQGPPAWRTLTDWIHADGGGPVTDPDDPVFLVHQKAEDGNGKLDRGLAPHLGVPRDMTDWHWATQLNQARAVRYAVEHYRSWWPRTAGWIVWQLNDCWPVTSWAVVDWEGRLKPAWYALRQASAPRVVSVVERAGNLAVALVNDTDQAWSGRLRTRRETFGGDRLAAHDEPVTVAPRSVLTTPMDAAVAAVADPPGEVVVVELDGLRTTWTAAEDVDLALDPQALTATATPVAGGYRVDLTARSYVRDATLLADRAAPDAQVDEQLITLPAGATATVMVTTATTLDPAVLTAAPVLRSANDLAAVPAREPA